MSDVLLLDVKDRVAIVTINRPEVRNALNSEIRARLPEMIANLDEEDDADVIILTGADPAFSAGIDFKELAAGVVETNDPHAEWPFFGGFEQSGIGREGGHEGLRGYLEAKTVLLDGPPSGYGTDARDEVDK